MKNFKRFFLSIFILSLCAVSFFFLWKNLKIQWIDKPKTEQFIQERQGLERLLKNSSEIHRIWQDGEDSREWVQLKKECLNYFKINTIFDESLLRCHPMILQCIDKFYKKLDFHFVSPIGERSSQEKIYRYLTKSNTVHQQLPASGYLFTIEDNQTSQKLNLFLSDSCHEVFLPKRMYAYGEEVQEDDYKFDNFDQNIYIDRHLITHSEINEWIDFGNLDQVHGLKKKDGNDLFLPATDLTMDQMLGYCSFRGKQLMLAHYFDAATFLPMDLAENNPVKIKRSPYYWTKKKSEFKPNCHYLYANECISKFPYRLNFSEPTWTGLMDAMGGGFEAFRNPIDPDSNLKASSMHFNFKSPWHKLGFRAGWDGEGFDIRHFDFKAIEPSIISQHFEVGFRCMRESK